MNDQLLSYELYFQAIRDDIRQMREDVNERLDRVNGTVRRHDTDIALLQSMAHPQESCPIVHQVVEDVAELKRARAETGRLWKLAGMVGAAFATIVQLAFVVLRYLRNGGGVTP